ncbi:hypothetical protein Efla_000066 [Eimeria flavescens]
MEQMEYQQQLHASAQPMREGYLPSSGGVLPADPPAAGPPPPLLQGCPPAMQQEVNAWHREDGIKLPRRQPVYQEMLKLQEKLESDVSLLENKIYEMEGNYLAATADAGNMLRGWEGYISSATKTRRPAAKTAGGMSSNQERLFSLTSTTSLASRELSTWVNLEEPERQMMGSAGGGKGWNNAAASQVSNSRNSACSTNVKCAKRPLSRSGSSSSSSKTLSGGRHSAGSAGSSTASAAQKACGSSSGGDSSVASACHGRM